jgi:hypothetical protein
VPIDAGIDAAETGGFEFLLPAYDLGIVDGTGRLQRAVLLQRLDDHARAGLGFEPAVLGRQHCDLQK